MQKKMKCFIASAFNHDDVDAMYDSCLVPILRKLSVTPLRVDRFEHNEDIDNKIFELLDSADFVIADLTYARPSVYYEAGYATGKSKPVIYTVKSDHFGRHAVDPYGNFRVHFDLQMKNIISWTKPNQLFSNRLLKRVQHVVRPLERQNQQDLKLLAERAKFDRVAVLDRLSLVQGIGIKLLQKQSFSAHKIKPVYINLPSPTQETKLMRFNTKRIQIVSIVVTSSASKRLFNFLARRSPGWDSLDRSMRKIPEFSQEETHYIIVSLKPVPRSQITDGMPYYSSRNNVTFASEYKSPNSKKTYETYVHIIDGIKSETEFSAAFRAVMNENGLLKQ